VHQSYKRIGAQLSERIGAILAKTSAEVTVEADIGGDVYREEAASSL
jgi:hypothetical protein